MLTGPGLKLPAARGGSSTQRRRAQNPNCVAALSCHASWTPDLLPERGRGAVPGQGGSARATLHGKPSSTWQYPSNGYVVEWEVVARAARQSDNGRYVHDAVTDFEWAERIVAATASLGRLEGGAE